MLMAVRLITSRWQRSFSSRSPSSWVAWPHGRARNPLARDCLEAICSTSGVQTRDFSSTHDVMGSAIRSSRGSTGWRLLHDTKIHLGLYNLTHSNAAAAALGRTRLAPATGVPAGPARPHPSTFELLPRRVDCADAAERYATFRRFTWLAKSGWSDANQARAIGAATRRQHTDEWLVQRALDDIKRKQARARQRTRPIVRREGQEDDEGPLVASKGEYILPVTSAEEKLAGVLGRPDLIVTRNVEWANLAFGFEQQNKYVIMDPREPQAPVGYILEDSNVFIRQFLRRRRPFVAHILDAYGNEVFRVRRPVWLITSTIYVEVDGKVVGEVHRRWHLWRRVYDCYLGAKQFAAVENPGFWYWTFTLHDENNGVLAVVDRNWRGFGFEFLTDAGQYVVRFGDASPSYVPSELRPRPWSADVRLTGGPILSRSSATTAVNEMQLLQAAAQDAERLDVVRPLSLSERAVVLALAVSLDNDYFSNHSSTIGFIPIPFIGGSEE